MGGDSGATADVTLDRRVVAYIALTGLFIASLTASNFLASKLFSVSILGFTLLAPAAVLAYALTFTFTDIISEVYGRRAANLAVRLGFAAQILVLLYAWFAVALPTSTHSPVGEEEFRKVVGSTGSIIAASLTAYLVSQHHDVWAFHLWKEKTRGRWLWLRNNASTLVSQLIDTVLFISLAFHVYPMLLHDLPSLPWSVIGTIIVSQYIIKALIALADTPLVYLGVAAVRRYIQVEPPRMRLGVIEAPGRLPSGIQR